MSGEPGWIRGPVRIRRSVVDAIRAHAKEAFPSECCGFASGPEGDAPLVDASDRAVNEADRYHALDPERFPRTSSTYFKINEMKAEKAFARGLAAGRPVKVIYHSHCDAGDYFSKEDAQTFASAETLMWPCAFVVVSVMAGEPVSQRLWVHRPGTNEFDEGVLEIVD